MNTLKNTKNWRIPSEYLIMEEPQIKFKSIMIIDDAELDLYIASHMIAKINIETNIFQYSIVEDALEYLELNQENTEALPEIIFIDIHMPIMSGFEFLKRYSKLSSTLKDHCKLFIISSTNDAEDINLILSDQNVIAIQEKPITKYFIENIHQLIKTKRNIF